MKSTFNAQFVTPQMIKIVENISFFRAQDKSGSFGILPRHTTLLTILEQSIAIVVIDKKEYYYAFNEGVLSFKNNELTITSKEFVQSDKINELLLMIKKSFKDMESKEHIFYNNIENLQKAFIKKLIEMEREVG